jgi:NitT/TauT family transport system substrate-binding protein
LKASIARTAVFGLLVAGFLASPLAGTAEAQTKKVRFSEVIRSIFYAPQYVAITQGFFKDEGLEVDLSTAQGSDKATAALLSGQADVALVGPETAIYIHNQEGPTKVKIFAQLTAKDGSFLMARNALPNFKWTDLKGKTVVSWRPGSMPDLVIRWVLKQHGLNPETDVNLIRNLQIPAMVGAFRSGAGDFVTLFEPTVSMLETEANAAVLLSVGEAAGPFPYTVFSATEKYMQANPEVIEKWVRAMYRAMLWVQERPDAEVARALAPYFDGTPAERLAASVARYKKIGAWHPVPLPDAKQIERLQDIMVYGGVLEAGKRVRYEDIVVPKYSEAAMRSVKR